MSAKARRPRRRAQEVSDRDKMPRWVKRLLVGILIVFILYLIFASWPLWLQLFY